MKNDLDSYFLTLKQTAVQNFGEMLVLFDFHHMTSVMTAKDRRSQAYLDMLMNNIKSPISIH